MDFEELLGFPVSRKSMRKSAFVRFEKSSTFKTQTGSKHIIYYSVHAIDRDGNKIVVGEGFKGESETNAAIQLMLSQFGLRENSADGIYGAEVLG